MNRKKMKGGSMETVLDCVIPYIHDVDDLNSISLVSRQFYELDCLTRKHISVHLIYALNPSRLSKRFPFVESLKLKGPPSSVFPQMSHLDITPWIQEIAVKFESLKALHIRGLVVGDDDLELLARTRGKDLRSLRIHDCHGFTTDGIMHISKYCNDLRTLCFEVYEPGVKVNMAWLYELAWSNTCIETLHFWLGFDCDDDEYLDASKALTLLAEKCSKSLVSLRVRFKRLCESFNTVSTLTRPTFTTEVRTEMTQLVTLAEKLRKLAVQLIADKSGLGSVKITYTSSIARDNNFNTPLFRATLAQGICVDEEQVIVDGSSDNPLEIIKVQIANVESRLVVAISEYGEIKVEGRVKDGVPHLTKVGALDVDVSLEGNIILCRQADAPNIIVRVGSILDDDNVIISSMSYGGIAQRKQAVMVIGVDKKPSKKALKEIDKIPAVEELVFLAL